MVPKRRYRFALACWLAVLSTGASLGHAHPTAGPAHSVTPFVHSVVMRALLERNAALDGWSFRAVEQLLADRFVLVGTRWTLPTNQARKDS